MIRRDLLLFAAAAALPRTARAQPALRQRRIGCLLFSTGSGVGLQYLDAFRQGLKELGHVEGRSIAFDVRSAEGRIERFAGLAEELVRLGVDLIAALSNGATHAARRATGDIPIVCFNLGDPVSEGLAANLARPGGNVTGFTLFGPELVPKGLSLLVEAVPAARRVAGLWAPGSLSKRTADEMIEKAGAAARLLGVELRLFRVQHASDLEGAFAAMRRDGAGAVLVLPSPLSNVERRRIAELALRHRLPSMSWVREFADAGGLMSYGSNIAENWRRGAAYADQILKGAKPSDLPIQQPSTFELIVNGRTARALGVRFPDSILARADEVIE